jgi:AP2-associated kinase
MFDKAIQSIKNTFKDTFKTGSKFIINGKEYTEEKLIAEGGYGYVYEVSDNRGNKYALKKMNILSNQQLQSIKKEVSIWKQISNNQNIVRMIDSSQNEKEVDILMELCTEGSLLDYINNAKGDITEKDALRIIKEISNGLYAMHSQKPPIAHRDIKIENVLKFGNNFKLCDFGSASTEVMIPQNESKQSLREKFDIYDKTTTFMYRPPEMVDEYSNYIVNEKVDIWALGCILFTILFKQQPFQDAQKLTIASADFYIPKEATKYSEKIFDFIRLMLTPNPNNRPNISQVLQYINNWNNISQIQLSNEVINIKKRQIKIFNEKKNTNSNKEISMDELEKAKMSIMKDLKKKNKYKKKDNTDLNDIFADDDEGYQKNDNNLIGDNNQKNKNLIDTQNTYQNKPMLFDFSSGFGNNNNNQQNQNNFGFDFGGNFNNNQNQNQNMGFNFNQNQFQNNNNNNMGFNFNHQQKL